MKLTFEPLNYICDMNRFLCYILILAFVGGMISCDTNEIEKPEHLIPRNKMIEMLVDVHLAKAYQQNQGYKDTLKFSSTDMYYSVLAKHNEGDSVFVKSVIYYSSYPRTYEKMYNEVIAILKEMEQETKDLEELNIGKRHEDIEAIEGDY